MAMKWAANFRNSTKFFIKIDDDIPVNMYALLPFLENYPQPVSNSILGLLQMHGEVIRNPNRKNYYMSKEQWPLDYYPPYCSGKPNNKLLIL